jgi:8-oxo-dGTP pyrophosphatase MutT (NUDIX family)
MLGSHVLMDGILRGTILQTSFASMLYWKSQGQPECGIRNIFGCGVIVSADGHLLFGRMGPTTAAPGRVYPVAGLPDLNDIVKGQLDLDHSIRRELLEETGLSLDDARADPEVLLVSEEHTCAVAKVLHFHESSSELKSKIIRHLEMCSEEELEDIVVLKDASETEGHNMPAYARHLVTYLFR